MMKLADNTNLVSAAVAFAHPAQVTSRVHTILQTGRSRVGVNRGSIIPFLLVVLGIAPLGTFHVIAQQSPTEHASPVRKSISHVSSAVQPARVKQADASLQVHAAVAQSVHRAAVSKASSTPALAISLNKRASSTDKIIRRAGQSENFPDVPKSHWAYQAVLELKEKGILIGYPPVR